MDSLNKIKNYEPMPMGHDWPWWVTPGALILAIGIVWLQEKYRTRKR